MKVLFDHQIFTLQKFGGISRYVVRLAEMLKSEGHTPEISAAMHQNYFLSQSKEFGHGRYYSEQFLRGQGRFALLFNDWVFRFKQKVFKPDIVHETFFSGRSLKSKKYPTVLTVYDMIHEKFPESFPANDKTAEAKRHAVQRADLVLCISESTREDLLSFVETDPSKVKVTYLGFDPVTHVSSAKIQYAPTDKPFLLYVGSRGGYKNFSVFMSAFAELGEKFANLQVVAFGGGLFSEQELALQSKLGIADRVFQIGGGDDFLNCMYQQAVAFVFPSLYEGFGIPPLEAMANGCPVISSNRSSMPEVIGNAGLFFNPEQAAELKSAIVKVVEDQHLRETLVAFGYERIKEFSWQKCMENTLKEYQELLDNV